MSVRIPQIGVLGKTDL